MASYWTCWAERALDLVRQQPVVDLGDVRALEHIHRTGNEPYHTLKSLIVRLREKEKR